MRSKHTIALVMVLLSFPAACRSRVNEGRPVRSRELLCEKDGIEIWGNRPSDEVIVTANRLGLDAAVALEGKELGNANASLEVTRKLERLKEQDASLNALELRLYLYAVSYCSGGLSRDSYERLCTRAIEGEMGGLPGGDGGASGQRVPKARPVVGEIVFYEGNGGTQDEVHTTTDRPGQNFRPRVNDEARSVILRNVRAGCRIAVYDSSNSKADDDNCAIVVMQAAAKYVVSSFEKSYADEYVQVTCYYKNGLDGKVSRIKID